MRTRPLPNPSRQDALQVLPLRLPFAEPPPLKLHVEHTTPPAPCRMLIGVGPMNTFFVVSFVAFQVQSPLKLAAAFAVQVADPQGCWNIGVQFELDIKELAGQFIDLTDPDFHCSIAVITSFG